MKLNARYFNAVLTIKPEDNIDPSFTVYFYVKKKKKKGDSLPAAF